MAVMAFAVVIVALIYALFVIIKSLFIILIAVLILGLIYVWYVWRKTKNILRSRRKKPDVSPRGYGIDFTEVSFAAEDNIELKGWFLPKADCTKTVIFLHGWGMNKADIFKYTNFLHADYNLFYFDFRAHGESGGKESGVGMIEHKDLNAALDFLKNNYPKAAENIALYGISMGATVAANRAASDGKIKCVVLEAMYGHFTNAIRLWAWTHKKIPYFPTVPLVIFFMRKMIGADFEAVSPASSAPKIKCHVLMIHGEFDNIAPLADAKKVFGLIPAPKEMWVVPNALHATCHEAAGEEYKEKLSQFFKKNF